MMALKRFVWSSEICTLSWILVFDLSYEIYVCRKIISNTYKRNITFIFHNLKYQINIFLLNVKIKGVYDLINFFNSF